jgi:N-hydroxyarylamine O-acetyltransferase
VRSWRSCSAEVPADAAHEFDLDAYLARIGLSGRPTVAELHRAHVVAIPFENLDPLRGVPVSLELSDLQRKLVAGRRGGYCFEHNLLFAAALRALGAEVEPMLARVGPREDSSRRLSHLLLRVRVDGAMWHADVGFGAGTLSEPIPFGPGDVFTQNGWRRRVLADGDQLVLRAAGAGGEWRDLYSFVPAPAPLVDIEMSNWFIATHPASRFVSGLAVTRHRPDGTRTSLSDWSGTLRLIEQRPAEETAREVERPEIPSLLAERFGLPGWTLDARGVPVPA